MVGLEGDLLPYTKMAGEGGYELDNFPKVSAWVARAADIFAPGAKEGRR